MSTETPEEATELRPAVRWFAEQMELALRRNDHKSGWLGCDAGDLFVHLQEEVRELASEIGSTRLEESSPAITREAADVANMAMMVADHCGPRIGSARAPVDRED